MGIVSRFSILAGRIIEYPYCPSQKTALCRVVEEGRMDTLSEDRDYFLGLISYCSTVVRARYFLYHVVSFLCPRATYGVCRTKYQRLDQVIEIMFSIMCQVV